MQQILLIGAGRSASSLIRYLLEHSKQKDWQVTVADMDEALIRSKTKGHPNARALVFDINNAIQREEEIRKADLVISMLPASMHLQVAKDCLKFGKHLVTASYVSPEIAAMDTEVKKAGLVFMNEAGLDPGIDHASAMKVIDHIKEQGGELLSFRSYCGGLVAPESNDNPWGYKFSWNPRNVILAGQGTAKYIENGEYRSIPYERLFLQTETITVEGCGTFDAYANRDSLSYRTSYGIENIPTMLRGTLRYQGYCKAWNIFVKLGLTSDSQKMDVGGMSYAQLVASFLPPGNGTIKERLKDFMGADADEAALEKAAWTGILSDEKITLTSASPAEVLQDLLERKWRLKDHDKDMIVMQHEFISKMGSRKSKVVSWLVVKGDDQTYTAMAKTVGLPVAITSKLILEGKIRARGVVIPVLKEIYEPLLRELEEYGIIFNERTEA